MENWAGEAQSGRAGSQTGTEDEAFAAHRAAAATVEESRPHRPLQTSRDNPDSYQIRAGVWLLDSDPFEILSLVKWWAKAKGAQDTDAIK